VSDQDKSDPARGWRHVEKLLGENDNEAAPGPPFTADDLMAAADAKLAERKAGAASPAPKPSPAVEPAPITMILPRRNRWMRPLVVAGALAAGSMIYLAARPPDLVGSAPLDDHVGAEKVRDQALARCAAKQWAACAGALDRARAMDPAGDDEPRVVKARGEIAAAGVGVGADGQAP
jgi:hypothetical protein